jgi:hypothetical protein
MADLAETPYRYEGDEVAAQGPALSRIARQVIDGTRVAVADTLDRLWAEVRFGATDNVPYFAKMRDALGMLGREDGVPSFRDFKEMVADAMRNGDQHEIPQVAEAAQFIRRTVFAPWKERAIKAGLLPEGVDVKTADSYFQRVYNHERIKARRTEFVDRVTDWLWSDQATKAAAKERLISLNRDLQGIEDALAKAKTEDRVVALTAERDGIRAKIEAEIGA